jgi:hypothetical protein
MQGGKAWVRRAYSGALNGSMNGVVSLLWKSAIGPFSILVFLYIMFVPQFVCYHGTCTAHCACEWQYNCHFLSALFSLTQVNLC